MRLPPCRSRSSALPARRQAYPGLLRSSSTSSPENIRGLTSRLFSYCSYRYSTTPPLLGENPSGGKQTSSPQDELIGRFTSSGAPLSPGSLSQDRPAASRARRRTLRVSSGPCATSASRPLLRVSVVRR